MELNISDYRKRYSEYTIEEFCKINESVPQNFKYLLVLDFKVTCGNEEFELIREEDAVVLDNSNEKEIIEFTCLMINTKKFEVENMFHSYVRPEIHPMLSDICLEANSGIKQKMVDSAPNFKQVFWSFEGHTFKEWQGLSSPEGHKPNFAFVLNGNEGFATSLRCQCNLSGLKYPDWAKEFINLKTAFKIATGINPRRHRLTINEMLKFLEMDFQGTLNSGIDDAHNAARVIKKLASNGYVFDESLMSKIPIIDKQPTLDTSRRALIDEIIV